MSLSIIIPAYNEEKLLPSLLSSILHSIRTLHDAYPEYPVEIIVIDNSSTDRTPEIALSYHAKVVLEEKRNVSAARNRGAKIASTDYLVFIDADYRVEGNFLREIIRKFEKSQTVVALGVRVVVEENDLDLIRRSIADFALYLLWIIKKMSFGVFAFRRLYFEHIGGFNEEFFAYEDVELHETVKRDLKKQQQSYVILPHVRVHASGRGFHRGNMIPAYLRMYLSRESRKNPVLCGYWYERK
jgi:glycosyltransferase involved in cell wall biosynthesis